MHVLLTNDDGPLDDKSCPYIKYLVDEIKENTDWDLSIVVPSEQRSWIGKAHFAGKTLTASYIYTKYSTGMLSSDLNSYLGPYYTQQDLGKEYQEWCLIDGTPAACADIGINHLYSHSKEKPIDLVLSGPNFGKNSGNLYILSSGTVGAAMEAVTHRVKSIAISYSYNDLKHDFNVLKSAAHISVKLINKLYDDLRNSKETDLFSINIPLVSSLNISTTKISYTPILENYWDSIYSVSDVRNNKGQKQFIWTPDFKKVYKDGLSDFSHSDNRVLLEEGISVTPLKAAFASAGPFKGEIKLDDNVGQSSANISSDQPLTALITIPKNSYVYEPLVEGFKKANFQITDSKDILKSLPSSKSKVFHYGEYEDLDFDALNESSHQYFVCTYVYRKALIRKHYLSNTIHHYVVKHPNSALVSSTPKTYSIEVDYAEFLDDALDDAYELRDEIENGSKTWILKPSMSDKGQGLRLFKSVNQLQKIFESFEEAYDTDDETDNKTGVVISQLRHFVIQEYKEKPLLLTSYSNRKFHLRVYVVSVGRISVFVYRNILTLFSDAEYQQPADDGGEISLDGHLTNTCLQEGESPLVVPFWELKDQKLDESSKTKIFKNICRVVGDLFDAAYTVDKINFQALDNALEIFGIDFLVEENSNVVLLEVNSFPDFKQTGEDLKSLIFELFNSVSANVAKSLITGTKVSEDSNLVNVLKY